MSDLEFRDDELICVVGPTASGKTDLAIQLCDRFNAEIVSADSVQVYRNVDLGSGKPSLEQLARTRHHLVGCCDPREPIDAAQFAQLAECAIRDIQSRGRRPIVCGGTFMWVRALVYGLAKAPPASRELRTRLESERGEKGTPAMHARLKEVDPATASRLSPNDWVRIQRALEVWELAGLRLSDLHAEHQATPPHHNAKLVGIRWEPGVLEQRIRARAAQWIACGWIDQVSDLIGLGFGGTRAMKSVGFRQVVEFLDGKFGRDELLSRVTIATKVFARRQRTWLRDAPVTWLGP